MTRFLLCFTIAIICFGIADAQYAINLTPRISADNSISERVAYTKINIDYGSPHVKGRTIWGDMEEYGQIWRAGANRATKISFSEDVKIGGKPLSEGEYTFFVIPQKDQKWTIIFNKVAEQWGAFNYDAEEDALRIEVDAVMNHHVEDLTFDIVAKHFEGASVSLEWEKVKLSFFVEVEHLKILEKTVAQRIADAPENTEWVIYLQAANYLVDEGSRLDLAEEWLSKSAEMYPENGEWSGQYYPKAYIKGDLLWARAKLAALKNEYTTALTYAKEMKEIEGDYVFYQKENESEQIDNKIISWEEAR